ncbi:TPA: hypothetical protein N0F65_002535 [Lagenidium giganteum]|uniref:Secreted protein n=1 Tax=Lagenidium giganteum TaxID=4803 RepID=A0AAV2YN07_9STRA|nr:TPA: hypothetical protein N0F65_007954 [Lagenidium giganteum]DAZ95350.1 TPA: hypothetical protein N0F65_002535 [Lagenidium giganteum]
MKLFVPALLAAVTACVASAAQLRSHAHNKVYFAGVGEQCAGDIMQDATMLPCRQSSECVRLSPTFGVCISQDVANKYRYSGVENQDVDSTDSIDSEVDNHKRRHHYDAGHKKVHKKDYVPALGEQCAFDVTVNTGILTCRDLHECVRINPKYGICMSWQAAAMYKYGRVESADIDSADSIDSEN